MTVLRKLLVLIACVLSTNALAAIPALVEQVQPPAWRERNGLRSPLAPGEELHSGDRILTGAGARAYLLLADGSRVKLGEQAVFGLYSHSAQPRNSFSGALDVLSGAFRFTTDAISKLRSKRNLTIRVATATIGIRGTDVWGRTDEDRDLVALIEGHISLTRAGEELSIAPMQYLDAPRGAAAQIKGLSPETLAALASQTEIAAGAPASTRRGKAATTVATLDQEAAALALYDQIRAAGFAARIRPVAASGAWHYEVRLTGFATADRAAAAAQRLRERPGIRLPPI